VLVDDELGEVVFSGLPTGQIRHVDKLDRHDAAPFGRRVENLYRSMTISKGTVTSWKSGAWRTASPHQADSTQKYVLLRAHGDGTGSTISSPHKAIQGG
jgi:hypothetical protein